MKITKIGNSFVADERLKQSCLRSFIGRHKNKKIYLYPEEVLFLAQQKKIPVYINKKRISLFDLFRLFSNNLSTYFAYRDWRISALSTPIYSKKETKRVPFYNSTNYYNLKPIDGFFNKKTYQFLSTSKYLYTKYWFGQFGAYKSSSLTDNLLKLDNFEAYYLYKKGIIKQKIPLKFKRAYKFYEDWRDKGYVVKTGFKFGSTFRIYLPKTKPNEKAHKHSKFVLHIFDKDKIYASEWARAIRVSHSVKKSFVFSSLPKKSSFNFRYYLYTRKGHSIKTPKKDFPSFVLYAIYEDQMLSLSNLAYLTEKAHDLGLDLMVAIVDRDTSVTYYRIRKIILEGSSNNYYEVLWFSK